MNEPYTTKLQVGLGLIEETRKLLDAWSPGMDSSDLETISLDHGLFPNVTSRRLKNIVHEGFSARYLVTDDYPAKYLKILLDRLKPSVFSQLLFVYTCRANSILADFVKCVYWASYAAGKQIISGRDAEIFVLDGINQGKTGIRWADSTIRRVSNYLPGACVDFGLLKKEGKSEYLILPYHIDDGAAAYLAHDLHFLGSGDNAVLAHQDWELFGLNREDVISEFKRLSLMGWFIVQSAGLATRIGWKYDTMMEVVYALAN